MKLLPVAKAPDWLHMDPNSGIYWVDIYRAQAKPKRLTRSTKVKGSKEKAKTVGEKMIAKWLGQDASGNKVRIKFKDICDQVLKHSKTKRAGTQTNADIYIGRLKESFGHLYVDQVTEGLWKNYEAGFRAQFPGMHFFSFHKHMSLVMNHAHKLGLLDRPWRMKMMTEDYAKPARVITADEKDRLMAVAPKDLKDQLLFAMTMGMRLREHLLLSWEQIDFDANTLRLEPKHTKTKKGRTIKLSPQVREMLERRFKKRDKRSPYVFPGRYDPSKPTNSNKKAWSTAKAKAKIKGRCRYHDIRHTFLTECAKLIREGRMSVALVCAYCGLSIRVFERTYLHLGPEDTGPVSGMIAVKLG